MKFKFSIVNNLKLLKIFIVLVFIVSLSGCASLKQANMKSSNNLFETFYVGEDGTQYFIKPLVFSNPQNKEKLHVDFTFRYKNEVKDSVTVNLSLLSLDIVKRIDSLSFSNTTHKVISKNIKLLFNEKRNKLFHSRFSTNISLIEINKMFESDDWKIIIHNVGTYTSNKRTEKTIKRLRDEIFILF